MLLAGFSNHGNFDDGMEQTGDATRGCDEKAEGQFLRSSFASATFSI
jgi:hypothetical protein